MAVQPVVKNWAEFDEVTGWGPAGLHALAPEAGVYGVRRHPIPGVEDVLFGSSDTILVVANIDPVAMRNSVGPRPEPITFGQDQLMVILSGHFIHEMEGEEHEMRRGDCTFIPANTRHTITLLDDEPITAIHAWLPTQEALEFAGGTE